VRACCVVGQKLQPHGRMCVLALCLKSSPAWRLAHAGSSAGVAAEGMVKPMVVASRAEGSTKLGSKTEDRFSRRSFVDQSTEKLRL
jgi:hypothetical protein